MQKGRGIVSGLQLISIMLESEVSMVKKVIETPLVGSKNASVTSHMDLKWNESSLNYLMVI